MNLPVDEWQLRRTQQTYSKIAPSYFVAIQHAHIMQEARAQFIAMLPVGAMVLDVGCGPGIDSAEFRANNLVVTSLDLSIEMMQTGRAHENGDFVQADMRQLPFARADAIWANASLLHLPRPAAYTALSDFARCLQPNGILFLSVKEGVDEEWVQQTYGHTEPRYFCYWQPEQLDNALTVHFNITHRAQKTTKRGVPWLLRFAQVRP